MYQNVIYKVRRATKKTVLNLFTLKQEGSDSGSKWNRFAFAVPTVPPSALPNCNLIDIQYVLEV